MAGQLLRGAGFGARPLPNAALGEAGLERLDPARIRLCCLSMLEEGSSAAGVRYFLRRLRRRLPEAVVVVGCGTPGRTARPSPRCGRKGRARPPSPPCGKRWPSARPRRRSPRARRRPPSEASPRA
jgi:hypothetical protein